MIKTQTKETPSRSRTLDDARDFAADSVWYPSTARKNAVNVFAAIQNVFCGKPFIPSCTFYLILYLLNK